MSLIVKTDAPVPTEGLKTVCERIARGTTVSLGEEIFIWTVENPNRRRSGPHIRGEGLARRGVVHAVKPTGDPRRRAITILLDGLRPRQPFTIADLAPFDRRYTDQPATCAPQETLAEKLLKSSPKRCIALTPDEAALLNGFFNEADVILPAAQNRAGSDKGEQARRRGAPPPTTMRRGVMHMRRAPAYTYAMAVRGAATESFKLGWSFDYRARERTFNLAALPELGGVRYETHLRHLWDTAEQAFKMEQDLLRQFDAVQHPTNREVVYVEERALQAAWKAYLMNAHRSQSAS